jgi:Ca2+-binding EF-hand superfamily protein
MNKLKSAKYSRYFQAADVNGDGVIAQEDLVLMSQRYIDVRNVPQDSPKAKQLNELVANLWTQIIAPCDRDGDGKVTREEMLAGFDDALIDKSAYPDQIGSIANLFFDLADANDDGTIDKKEFTHIFGVGGQSSETDCADVFRQLDLDSSGGLSREEFHKAVIEFFYGTDPAAPANHLFGHL